MNDKKMKDSCKKNGIPDNEIDCLLSFNHRLHTHIDDARKLLNDNINVIGRDVAKILAGNLNVVESYVDKLCMGEPVDIDEDNLLFANNANCAYNIVYTKMEDKPVKDFFNEFEEMAAKIVGNLDEYDATYLFASSVSYSMDSIRKMLKSFYDSVCIFTPEKFY